MTDIRKNEPILPKDRPTRVDRLVRRYKNNKITSIIIFSSIMLVGIATVLDATKGITDFLSEFIGISQPGGSLYSANIRIWSLGQGDPISLEFVVDNKYIGTLNNVSGDTTLHIENMSEGIHEYELRSIKTLNYQGESTSNHFNCKNFFKLDHDTQFTLSVHQLPDGSIRCDLI